MKIRKDGVVETQPATLKDNAGAALTATPVNSKNAIDVYAVDQEQMVKIEDLGTTAYFGYAPIGSSGASAVWRIKRLSTSGGVDTVTWADGNTNYDNVWDNRAILSYS